MKTSGAPQARGGRRKDNPETDRGPSLVLNTPTGPGNSEEVMNWGRWLAALFIAFALAGCAQGVAGQAQTPYGPYAPENNGNMHDSGGGGSGGGGSM